MKIKRLLIGMLACSAMVACTNDELLENNGNENQLDADKAYVVVNIKSAEGAASRAEDGGLSEGIADEHAIDNAYFYFYSAEGTYITEGEVLGSNLGGSDDNPDTENIEWKTNTVVVLQGLAQKGTPKYVLAVLNKPTTLSLSDKSIAEAQKFILGSKETVDPLGGTKNGAKFIMTNSTYNGTVGTDVDGIGYFATAIAENQFLKEPIKDATELQNVNAVDIYVERLAAKVKFDITATDATATITGENKDPKKKYYALDQLQTVVGNETAVGSKKQYYIRIDGWGLNAINKQTYLMKNVPSWDKAFANWDGTAWNAGDKRTFWGHSWNYGLANEKYPANFNNAVDNGTNQEGSTTDTGKGTTTPAEYALDYVKWSELDNTVAGSLYCAENTNNVEILEAEDKNFHSTVTEVLLAATLVDATGTPVELFRYDNVLYDRANYLERLFAKVNPQIYRVETTGEGESAKTEKIYISSEDVAYSIKNENDGYVSVDFTGAKVSSYVWYKDEDDKREDVTATLGDALDAEFAEQFANERNPQMPAYVLAKHYNGGMMYYNIPIEHLVKGDNTPYTEGVIDVAEAEYGVVRNHWYQVTVSSIKKLGSAVHDANEDIIPDEAENVTYYVAARINVLSWKVVEQNVEL